MTDRELNIALRETARAKGLCDEWYSEWKDEDSIDMCLERYVKGFDFVSKNDWPSPAFFEEHLRKSDLHRHHIYVNESVDLKAVSGYYIFLGRCRGVLSIDGPLAVTVYLRHDSKISIVAHDGARVFVGHYDDSQTYCKSDSYSKIMKYDHQSFIHHERREK